MVGHFGIYARHVFRKPPQTHLSKAGKPLSILRSRVGESGLHLTFPVEPGEQRYLLWAENYFRLA